MTNWLHKKILPLLLSLTFSVVGFGVFVDTAHAGIKNDIIKDLSIPFTESDLPYINEIPRDITPDQAANILNTIETDEGVVSALNELRTVAAAKDAAQNNYDAATTSARALLSGGACMIPPSTTEKCNIEIANTTSAEKTALDEAKTALESSLDKLGKRLASARNNQDPLISQLQKLNELANLTSSVVSELGTTTTSVSADYSETAIRDEVGAEPPIVNPADIPPQDNAALWNLTAGDEVVIAMQDACVIFDFDKETDLVPCFAGLTYKLIYVPVSQVLRGSGLIFDELLMLSIDNEKDMVVPKFIDSAWTVVRDFSNMLFIFILLYTGIMTMFGAADWRKTVLQVVIVALLINFSLFFTKVIIDAGNVLAVGIRSSISTEESGGSISAGLVSAFQPQKFLRVASEANGAAPDGGAAIVVFLVASVVSGYAAYILFKAALLFLGRLIAFWFLMVVSPFAFISTTLPQGNKFKEWFDTLLAQAFVAPVFLFFIYLIMMVIQSGDGILASFSSKGTGWFEQLLGPVIVATILCFALKKALEFAEDMAGSFGKVGSQAMGAVISGATMVATGGATAAGVAGGALGRKYIGGAAARELESGAKSESELTAMSGEERSKYEARRTTLQKRTQRSYDVRNFADEFTDKNSLLSKTISGKVFKKEYAVGGVEKVEKDKIQKELKATEAGKASIFEENAIRGRAGAQREANQENLVKATAAVTTAESELTEQLKAYTKAQEAHDASGVERLEREAEIAYENARKQAESSKGTPDEDRAARRLEHEKSNLDTARANNANSQKTVADTKMAHEKAKKAKEEAVEAKALAEKESKKSVADVGREMIDAANKSRAEVNAKKAEEEGRHSAAAEIRGKMKGKSVEDTLKDLLKKEKEAGGKPSEEPKEKSQETH